MLASQESMLRSQPSEADYRAATVKQRPTIRRITPAEISVSISTRSTLADRSMYARIYWHTYKLHLSLFTHSITAGLHKSQQFTCTHVVLYSLYITFL